MCVRAFISIDVEDGKILKKIESLESELNRTARVKTVRPENIHLTLRFLGEIDSPEGLLESLREKCAGFGSFDVELRGVGGFPSDERARVVWVGAVSPELALLKERVDSAIGFEREERFVGHVTIGRVKQGSVAGFIRAHRNFEAGRIKVTSIRLKQSILTTRGPIYSTVGEVEL